MHSRSTRRMILLTLVASFFALVSSAPAYAAIGSRLAPQTVYGADRYEPDNRVATARTLPESSIHILSSSTDRDYAKITSDATGQPFAIETQYIDGSRLDTKISVYSKDASGTLKLEASNDDGKTWADTSASELLFTAPKRGTFYVVVAPSEEGRIGRYVLHLVKGIGRRVAGPNRYSTAAEISYAMFPGAHLPASHPSAAGPASVVIVNATNPIEAMIGGSLAASTGVPLLLTDRGALPGETIDEIYRLTVSRQLAYGVPFTVYVVGGAASVSNTVIAQLKALQPVDAVWRVSGSNRFATAARVAKLVKKKRTLSDTAFVVNGHAWPDALAVAPVAQAASSTVLLTGGASLSSETSAAIASLGVKRIVVVGGTGVVSKKVTGQLSRVGAVTSVERIAGADRYETARKVANAGVSRWGMDRGRILLASGATFADALPSASMSYYMDAPLLLTRGDMLSGHVKAYAAEHGPFTGPSYVMGGAGVITSSTYGRFKALWRIQNTR